jgi:hypothetical protein
VRSKDDNEGIVSAKRSLESILIEALVDSPLHDFSATVIDEPAA